MILGKVIGNIVSTIKLEIYEGYKILIVQPVDPDGGPLGKAVLAIDTVQAGVGDTVLVIDEGNSARVIINDTMAPVRCVVAGIVDHVLKEVTD
ncbi:MAG: EutN/CcmL family microcompartment protein [Spirochaetota bacterium]|nr:MAG: EutN/CcmL family microcompartment protein [Spirochaetota bacterium]